MVGDSWFPDVHMGRPRQRANDRNGRTSGLVQKEPIWLYENMILDGRNRAIICEQLGVPPVTKVLEQ
jgi:hypothetical protein